MKNNKIKNIAVIGSGTMGSQIAMVCALGGYQVTLQDINEDSLAKAKQSLEGHMQRRIKKGKLSDDQVSQAFECMRFTSSLEDAVKESDFVIEAIVEKLDAKRALFTEADRLAPDHTILATNSSRIVSSEIADATNRPEKICNMHFFNPVLVMELVEVVQGPHTSEETTEITSELIKRINKIPILLKKEINGFVANRMLGKLMDEAIYLLENEIANVEEIDLACTKALNHPIGPFALMDLVGIDVVFNARVQNYDGTGEESMKPSTVLIKKVEKGELGRKTGKGFYTYS
ncbi:3-hydroxybutyryl-CoA dehydrogenase [Scopulibacillus darangshiensis]|uniref:3-hydroxybutyryl-CoA dehydrogenase n=1 Tax=Scopulibacillus darangshiensis TaxID=442528 RepID=A0A4R2NVL7_9BACL|nr:3-hydroxyacyl-CoA dehydrogenase family protein [Scopulibacillus darangshiensis]TCP25614.1 3-hydroxybutyryl-CoA dehydrogenase [Scopulibacillus darangshiensis]